MFPPSSLLPPGAARWEIVNELAIRLKKGVRTIESWCARGLLHSEALAGGYGGLWVAVTAEGWPLNGPNVDAYRLKRSKACRDREAARRAARASDPKKKTTRARRHA